LSPSRRGKRGILKGLNEGLEKEAKR